MRIIAIVIFVLCSTARATVTIATVTDDTTLDAQARKANAEAMRRAIVDVVAPVRGPARQIDASIVAWRVEGAGAQIEVTAMLQLAVCDAHGRLISIVSGRATVAAHRRESLTELRKQAVESAVHGAARPLRAALQPAV